MTFESSLPWTKAWLLAFMAVSLLFSGTWGQARADLVLDQFNTPVNTGEAVILSSPFPFDEAQTFTVGVSGTLARIDVLVREDLTSTGDLLFDIRSVSGGIPAASNTGVLASAILPHGSVPTDPLTTTYTSIDISPFGLSVTEGDVLAIVLRTDKGGRYLWKDGTPVYSRGDPFFRQPNLGPDWQSWSSAGQSFDFAFRTFVDVPEPSTLLLSGLGILGLFSWAMYRRRVGSRGVAA